MAGGGPEPMTPLNFQPFCLRCLYCGDADGRQPPIEDSLKDMALPLLILGWFGLPSARWMGRDVPPFPWPWPRSGSRPWHFLRWRPIFPPPERREGSRPFRPPIPPERLQGLRPWLGHSVPLGTPFHRPTPPRLVLSGLAFFSRVDYCFKL